MTFPASLWLIPCLMLITALLLRWAHSRLKADDDALIDAVDAVLPQTQCAQCGYPGCRPYAEALVAGAALDLCPPGGAPTQQALAALLGRPAGEELTTPLPQRAVIDESRCIGCFLCVEACPVDAIVGAPQYLHTVIEDRCTGCELCLPPCPVDCIDLVSIDPIVTAPAEPADDADALPETTDCIRCGACQTVCPEGLQPDQLWWTTHNLQQLVSADEDLDACIECGLCNPVCPSGIDLLGTFVEAKKQLAARARMDAEAVRARKLFEERRARLAHLEAIARERREARIRSGNRQW